MGQNVEEVEDSCRLLPVLLPTVTGYQTFECEGNINPEFELDISPYLEVELPLFTRMLFCILLVGWLICRRVIISLKGRLVTPVGTLVKFIYFYSVFFFTNGCNILIW